MNEAKESAARLVRTLQPQAALKSNVLPLEHISWNENCYLYHANGDHYDLSVIYDLARSPVKSCCTYVSYLTLRGETESGAAGTNNLGSVLGSNTCMATKLDVDIPKAFYTTNQAGSAAHLTLSLRAFSSAGWESANMHRISRATRTT